MPRPLRQKLKFDEESLNKLVQETYNDMHNNKSRIITLFTKWEKHVKDEGHIAALGDQIVKIIQTDAKNIDQKFLLAKLLKDTIFSKGSKKNKDDDEDYTAEMTSEQRNEILKIVETQARTKNV